MPLPRRISLKENEKGEVPVNVYDINTKEIVFYGNQCDAAAFLGVPHGHLSSAIRKKSRIRNQYAVRLAKELANSDEQR